MTSPPTAPLRCLVVALAVFHLSHASTCLPPQSTIALTNEQVICDQPYYFTILPKSEDTVLLDNVCLTFYPLPDDPNIFFYYTSFVYCDGSNSVQSAITARTGIGSFTAANPMGTFGFSFFGYAGCDTYLAYMCPFFGQTMPASVVGVSTNCAPVGLSCLRKIDEIIEGAGFPKQDMYILPNKLPNRCVTQQLCIAPPNPFYNKLPPSVGLL